MMKHLPYYCWECITLNTDKSSLNLVIKNEQHMKKFLEFLIVQLKTINGKRDSAAEYLNTIMNSKRNKSIDKKEV